MRRPLPVVLLVALVLLPACALRRPRPTLPPATAADLLAGLAARRTAVTSLRARARLRAGLAGMWSRQAVLVRRPDEVRIDVFSPVGLAYALGADGDVLWAYPPSEHTRYQGPATPANVSRILGAPIALADVVDVLLGLPPARRPTAPPVMSITDDGEYCLVLPLADGQQTLWFGGAPLAVRRAEELRTGWPVLRLAFDDYADGLPRAITVESPSNGARVELAYQAMEPNAAIDPALFGPPPAPRVLPLEAAVKGAMP